MNHRVATQRSPLFISPQQWKADDKALWTKYGGDSEEESESEENNEDDKTLEDKEKIEQEKRTEIERLNATTARQIKEVSNVSECPHILKSFQQFLALH